MVITFYRTQCQGPGLGGGAHLIHMVQPITGFDK